jgi:hypothetical protein
VTLTKVHHARTGTKGEVAKLKPAAKTPPPATHKTHKPAKPIPLPGKTPVMVLNSNGTLLGRRENIDKILRSPLRRFILSLDGLSKEVFESVRVNARWDQVYPGVEELCRQRIARGRNAGVAGLQHRSCDLDRAASAGSGLRLLRLGLKTIRGQWEQLPNADLEVLRHGRNGVDRCPAGTERLPCAVRADRTGESSRVAAVRVHQDDAAEGVGRPAELHDHQRQGRLADRQRASEAVVLAAGSHADGRSNQSVQAVCGRVGDGGGDAGVGVERQVGAVLFARTDRHEQDRLEPTQLGRRQLPQGAAQRGDRSGSS